MPTLKRPRHSYAQEGDDTLWQRVVGEELDLEILIRQRLAETVESRIAWALQLQEALQKGNNSASETSRNEFKIAAEDALDAIEAPCDLLLHHEPEYAALPAPVHDCAHPPADEVPLVSTTARPTRASARDRVSGAPKPLYIMQYNESGLQRAPTPATLACPDCGRADFPSLQGLLNHTRIKHSRAYGSHDECVAACAVPVHDAARRAWVLAHGVEVPAGAAARPSLRRLFENAVGAAPAAELLNAAAGDAADMAAVVDTEVQPPAEDPLEAHVTQLDLPASSERARHLALTLGLHKDSTALAPFLGRDPKRRCINVYDEDEEVDIGGDRSAELNVNKGSPTLPSNSAITKRWYPPHYQRGRLRERDQEIVLDTSHDRPPKGDAPISTDAHAPYDSSEMIQSTSRFHLGARIAVSDRSLWIPKSQRPTEHPEHTHRWMISIESPSYTRPLTTFLTSMTISSLTDPPPAALRIPLTISEPPFFASGTASAPFLARITLSWAPSSADLGANAPLDAMHWVELDLHQRGAPVLGEEQLVDVELDRGTMFADERLNEIPTTNWDGASAQATANGKRERRNASRKLAEEVPAYAQRLRSLVPQVPVTMKDVTTRHPPRVPYHLAPTPNAFRKLLPGRRKAIEFAVARVLQDAYHRDLPSDTEPDLIPLTAADVHRWLETEGRFPRPPRPKPAPAALAALTQPTPPVRSFCPLCGADAHERDPVIKQEAGVKAGVDAEAAPACPVYPSGAGSEYGKLPLLDLRMLLRARQAALASDTFEALYGLPRALFIPRPATVVPTLNRSLWTRGAVAAADPRLTLALRALIAPLRLSAFGHADTDDAARFPLARLGRTADDVDRALAPHALLALLLSPVVRQLVRGGVAALRTQSVPAAYVTSRKRAPARRPAGVALTPLHVLQGVCRATSEGSAGPAMFLCLVRLGADASLWSNALVDGKNVIMRGEQPGSMAEVQIKQEEN